MIRRMLLGIKQRAEMLARSQVPSWISFGEIDAVERAAMGVTNKLQRAILLIRSGDKREGGRLLAEVLQTDPQNETAWFWMSGIVPKDEQRIDCLQRVLQINPENHVAREALVALRGKQTSPPEAVAGTWLPAEAGDEQGVDFEPTEPLEAIPRPAPPLQTRREDEQAVQPKSPPETNSIVKGTTDLASEEPPQSGPVPPSETSPLKDENGRFNVSRALILPLIALSASIVSTLLCSRAAQDILAGAVPDSTGPRAFWRFFFSWLLTLLGPMGVIIVGVLVTLMLATWALSRIIRPPVTLMSGPVDQQVLSVTRPEPVSTSSATPTEAQRRPTASASAERFRPWSMRTLLIAAILAILVLVVAACASLFLGNSYAAPGLLEGSNVTPFFQLCQGLAIH